MNAPATKRLDQQRPCAGSLGPKVAEGRRDRLRGFTKSGVKAQNLVAAVSIVYIV